MRFVCVLIFFSPGLGTYLLLSPTLSPVQNSATGRLFTRFLHRLVTVLILSFLMPSPLPWLIFFSDEDDDDDGNYVSL